MTPVRHHIARALGVQPGSGCTCALCGDSPFDVAGPCAKMLGAGWSDWDLMHDRTAPDLCRGCHRLLSGKPGSVPAPIRLRNLSVIGGVAGEPDRATFWQLLTAPPSTLEVLSWATSRQKQHHLHADWCTPGTLVVGSDAGAIRVRPLQVSAMTAALLTLRQARGEKPLVSRAEILSGQYAPATISRVGAGRWAEAEAAIAPHRGAAVLALHVEFCPMLPADGSDTSPSPSHPMATDTTDDQCVELLGTLAHAARLRTKQPKEFWAHLFVRRVQRHAHRTLPDFVARCMRDLEVETTGDDASHLAALVTHWTPEEEAAVMRRLADRAPLLVALTYDARKSRAGVSV